MAVNISKTSYIIFHTKDKIVHMNRPEVIYDCNELITTSYDPNLAFRLERIHDNHPNTKMRNFKFLGVFFDENLTFNKHAQILCATLTRTIYCMRRVTHFISPKSLKALYFALFHSYILYCQLILNCMSQSNLATISRLQHKAICVLTNSAYNAETCLLFYSNKILPFMPHQLFLVPGLKTIQEIWIITFVMLTFLSFITQEFNILEKTHLSLYLQLGTK
jgi:hypothetical protein